MVTDLQVRRLFDMRNKHEHLYQAADAAGMSSKTARKYLKNAKLPSQCRVEHTWLTRQDPFADDWAFIEQILEDTQATLEAKTLLRHLQMAYPGKYHNGQLRTLQRRRLCTARLKRFSSHSTTNLVNGHVRTLRT